MAESSRSGARMASSVKRRHRNVAILCRPCHSRIAPGACEPSCRGTLPRPGPSLICAGPAVRSPAGTNPVAQTCAPYFDQPVHFSSRLEISRQGYELGCGRITLIHSIFLIRAHFTIGKNFGRTLAEIEPWIVLHRILLKGKSGQKFSSLSLKKRGGGGKKKGWEINSGAKPSKWTRSTSTVVVRGCLGLVSKSGFFFFCLR